MNHGQVLKTQGDISVENKLNKINENIIIF